MRSRKSKTPKLCRHCKRSIGKECKCNWRKKALDHLRMGNHAGYGIETRANTFEVQGVLVVTDEKAGNRTFITPGL